MSCVPDEPAAKLWELLRRNERFRGAVKCLAKWQHIANASTGPDGIRGREAYRAWSRGLSLLERIDEQNPLAAGALRWLVPEPIFLQLKFRIERGTKHTLETVERQWSVTTADPKRKRQWKRGRNSDRLDPSDGEPNRWGPEIKLVTSDDPRLANECRDELAEWRDYIKAGRRFTVDTPWSEAPPTFQRLVDAHWTEISGKGRVAETEFFRDWHLVDLVARARKAVTAGNQLARDLVADLGRVGQGESEQVCPPVPTKGGHSLRVVPQMKFDLNPAEKLRLYMFDDLARHRVFALPNLLTQADVAPVLKKLRRQLLAVLPKAHDFMGTRRCWEVFVKVERFMLPGATNRTQAVSDYFHANIPTNRFAAAQFTEADRARWLRDGRLVPPAESAPQSEQAAFKIARKRYNEAYKAEQSSSRHVPRWVAFIDRLSHATFPRLVMETLREATPS